MENERRQAVLRTILTIVSEETGVSTADIKGKCRNRDIVDARKLFCVAADKQRHIRFVDREIGGMINRNASTALFSKETGNDLMVTDRAFEGLMRRVLIKVNSALAVTEYTSIPQL